MQELSEKSYYDLGAQQRSILDFLWSHPGATVRQVWLHLSPDRSLAYTSILSALQKLENLGWVFHQASGRRYVYFVSLGKEEAQQLALKKFLRRVYGKDPQVLSSDLLPGRTQLRSPLTLRALVDMKRGLPVS